VVVVPGYVELLPAFDARAGTPAGRIALAAHLAVLPVFVSAGEGLPLAIAITGSLENRWIMALMGPSPVPALPVQPLTTLPGEALPLTTAPGPLS
jgi:hypothetical protein